MTCSGNRERVNFQKTNVFCLFFGCWDSTGGLRLFVFFLSIYRSYRCNPFYFTSISRTIQTEQFSWLKGECTYDRTQSERQVFKTKVSEVVQTRLVLTWLTDWLTEGWTEPPYDRTVRSQLLVERMKIFKLAGAWKSRLHDRNLRTCMTLIKQNENAFSFNFQT